MTDFFYSLDDKKRIIQNIVLEFCDMSLEDKLREVTKQRQAMPMVQVKHYCKQIFQGLDQLHQKGIAHRDLKPENILLTSNGKADSDPLSLVVKIADLGATKVLDLSEKRMNTPYVVSRYYRSPELILGSHYYDFSIDVWATGCILFELITRTPLFPGEQEGLQILEQAQILGMPSKQEMESLANICEAPVIQLFKRNVNLRPVDIVQLLTAYDKRAYDIEEIKLAADLI